MQTIATFNKPEEAHLAASFLEANGIKPFVRDENMVTTNWFYSTAIGGVKLEVLEEDFEKAKEVLKLPVENEVILKCPHCGSGKTKMRELNPLTAILLILTFNLFIPAPAVKVDCGACGKSFMYRKESVK